MTIFLDPPPGFTHRAIAYGFPCYVRWTGPEECELVGTNVVADWCLDHVAPCLHWIVEGVAWAINPAWYQPAGWRVYVRGEIER